MKRHWYRNHEHSKFHLESPDWVRSGKAMCGRPIKNPGWTITTGIVLWPDPKLFCLDCSTRARGEQ